jgi:hypothetical protein
MAHRLESEQTTKPAEPDGRRGEPRTDEVPVAS